MTRFTKPAIALVLLCVSIAGLAACGSNDDSSSGATSGAPDTEKVSGTVTIWDWGYEAYPEYTEAIKQIDKEFEKANPDVKVDRVSQPPGTEYLALARAALVSGDPPDAMGFAPGNNGILTFADFLEPLNDRIDPTFEEHVSNWSSVTPGLVEEGTHYGIPSSPNGTIFYYNKKLFAKAGLPVDFQPESWSELREAGEKLKAAGILPFADGGKGGEILGEFMFGLGLQTENTPEEIGELQTGEMPYTDPGLEKAFDPFIELYEADLFSADVFSKDLIEGFSRFEEEEGAMVVGLFSVIGSYTQFAPKLGEKNLGMFRAPGADGISTFSSIPRAIPEAADNKDAAWALLEFEASKESQEILVNKGGSLPIRDDVSLPPGTPVQGLELAEAGRNGETVVFPLLVLSSEVSVVLAPEIDEAVQGRISVPEVQSKMQEAQEKASS